MDTADADNEIRQLTRAATAEASPSWSPDGRNIILTSTVAYSKLPIYAIPQLATVDVATGELSIIDALAETQVFSPRFSADGKALLAITEYRGQQQLVRVEQETGAVQALVEGRDVVVEFDLSTKGAIVLKVARPGRPGELFALAADGIRQLSTVNEAVLGRLQIGRVEKFGYESDDGTPMETFIVYPPDYTEDRTYPGMLHIHGGPQEQWDYRFDSESQLFAAQGYIVVMPNPRGSWGYGQTFGEAIYRDWGVASTSSTSWPQSTLPSTAASSTRIAWPCTAGRTVA